MTRTIHVTAGHITAAVRHLTAVRSKDGVRHFNTTGENNPVALAVREQLGKPHDLFIAVWSERIQIGENVYRLPSTVDMREQEFTRTATCKPYEFELSNEPAPVPVLLPVKTRKRK